MRDQQRAPVPWRVIYEVFLSRCIRADDMETTIDQAWRTVAQPQSARKEDQRLEMASRRPTSRLFGHGFRGWLFAVALLAAQCMGRSAPYEPSSVIPPPPMREMRAAWVASVGNLDWPSTNAILSTAKQKTELMAILDQAVRLKLNTIIFQVRPACDALYASSLEPWSEYLTGTMGKRPEPFYDPLAFAVEEAHKRGLELHAWFNPFRARDITARSPISANHISQTHPAWVHAYGKYLWLDPGEKAVQEYSLSVVLDVVKRYDIDGVHFDDYFYPYPEKEGGRDRDFPDESSWSRYGAGGKQSREDWRRENVNNFVQRTYQSIKAVKPRVKFGISPFGIWRPQNPPSIKGMDAYAEIYADSRKWLVNGWVDYFAPQLYWAIDKTDQSFPVLLKWWEQQNARGRLLCPGLNSYNFVSLKKPEEILNQIRLTRKEPGASGHIHFRMSTLMRDGALVGGLERQLYSQPALVPACPWLDRTAPAKPNLTVSSAGGTLAAGWAPGTPESVWLWVLQTRTPKGWTTEVLPAAKMSCALARTSPEVIALTAINRSGNASRPAVIERKAKSK
jgi:uncharacterized lipoprotein YddW (UPF0748 family)